MRRAVALLAWCCLAAPLSAQGGATHVVLVTGLSGEPAYATTFQAAADQLFDVAHTQWRVADSSLWLLSENPGHDSTRARGRSTRDGIATAIAELSRRVKPGDVVLLVLIGHGSGEGPDSRVDLPGPDATARDYALWLAPFTQQAVVVVVAASASGDFATVLAAPRRVVITATKAATERNESLFAQQFARGIGSGEADADKDGRITAFEAFDFARTSVRAAYDATKRLLTEHAQLTGDEQLARQVGFGPPRGSSDPRIAALLAERVRLEAAVAELRGRKTTTDSLAYARELEQLLVQLAEKTRAIRLLEQGGAP